LYNKPRPGENALESMQFNHSSRQRHPYHSQGSILMSKTLAQMLAQQGFVVLDGALATELEQKGADLNDPLWSARCLIEAPELISQVHHDYLVAGADIISSATYQASEAGFKERGMSTAEARALLKSGVTLAIQARNAFWIAETKHDTEQSQRIRPLVAASMGPFGACLHDGSEYHGNYAASWREVSVFHRERMLRLAEAGADLLAFETIPSLAEAEVLLELLEKHVADLHGHKAWISFSCKDALRVCHGEYFADCLDLLNRSDHVAAAGINCTPPDLISGLLKAAAHTDIPLMVYPNSGETWVSKDHCWIGQGKNQFAISEWYSAGARLIGGCCRTRPDDISAMRKTLLDLAQAP